jgi:hypothetical protein
MSWPRRVTEEQLNKADAERLRDTFAAAALTGLLADQSLSDLGDITIATRAYELASAMIEERVKWSRAHALTDAEREAIEDAAGICEEHSEEYDGKNSSPISDTLRKLLARLA